MFFLKNRGFGFVLRVVVNVLYSLLLSEKHQDLVDKDLLKELNSLRGFDENDKYKQEDINEKKV